MPIYQEIDDVPGLDEADGMTIYEATVRSFSLSRGVSSTQFDLIVVAVNHEDAYRQLKAWRNGDNEVLSLEELYIPEN